MAAIGRHRFFASAEARNSQHKTLERFYCLCSGRDGSGAVEYEFMNHTFHVGIEQPKSNDEKT